MCCSFYLYLPIIKPLQTFLDWGRTLKDNRKDQSIFHKKLHLYPGMVIDKSTLSVQKSISDLTFQLPFKPLTLIGQNIGLQNSKLKIANLS